MISDLVPKVCIRLTCLLIVFSVLISSMRNCALALRSLLQRRLMDKSCEVNYDAGKSFMDARKVSCIDYPCAPPD